MGVTKWPYVLGASPCPHPLDPTAILSPVGHTYPRRAAFVPHSPFPETRFATTFSRIGRETDVSAPGLNLLPVTLAPYVLGGALCVTATRAVSGFRGVSPVKPPVCQGPAECSVQTLRLDMRRPKAINFAQCHGVP